VVSLDLPSITGGSINEYLLEGIFAGESN